MNNISFQGNVTVTTWNKSVASMKEYYTTPGQDRLIKSIANDLGKEGSIVPVKEKSMDFIRNLLERFTGNKVQFLDKQKVFYNGGDNLILTDLRPAKYNGTRVEVNLGEV